MYMHPLLKELGSLIIDTLFPLRCLVCEKSERQFICTGCFPKLQRVDHQRCIVCQKPNIEGMTHAHCQSAYKPHGLLSWLDYRDKHIAQIIINGKYNFLPDVYTLLGFWLADDLTHQGLDAYFENFYLVPIPLAAQRLRWRGFNQSQLLCEALAEKLRLPILQCLIRHTSTETQKDLDKDQRRTNVAGCFKLNDAYDIKNKNLIIVDDVITTGATLLEACKVLKRSGAAQVWCLTVARD
jgi:competence protein ComFC